MLASSLLSVQYGGKGRKGQSKQNAGSQKPKHIGATAAALASLFQADCISPLWDSVNSMEARTRASSASLGRERQHQEEWPLGRLLDAMGL